MQLKRTKTAAAVSLVIFLLSVGNILTFALLQKIAGPKLDRANKSDNNSGNAIENNDGNLGAKKVIIPKKTISPPLSAPTPVKLPIHSTAPKLNHPVTTQPVRIYYPPAPTTRAS